MAAKITLLATIGEDFGVCSAAKLISFVAYMKTCMIQAREIEYFIRFRVAANINAAGRGPTHCCLRAKVQELVRFKTPPNTKRTLLCRHSKPALLRGIDCLLWCHASVQPNEDTLHQRSSPCLEVMFIAAAGPLTQFRAAPGLHSRCLLGCLCPRNEYTFDD